MKRIFSVLLLAVFLIVPAVGAQAATWYVNWDATPGGDGTTWPTAFQTIQEAIDNATTIDDDEIWVRAGTYTLGGTAISVSKAVAIYGGFLGGETLLSQRDWANNVTIVDGGGLSRCFGVTDDATIDGFSIVNGTDASDGAGIYIDSTSATITNCILKDNEVTGGADGGGIACDHNYSSLVYITNCIFVGNSATSGDGGGIEVGVEGGVVITNCTFSGNTAGGSGGAIRADGSINSATITNCIFWGNSAPTDNEISGDLGVTVTYCNIDQDGYAGSDGNIRQDPRFKDVTDPDPANWDLHLRLASPCIDVGDNGATGIPTTDIDGAARTVAADCDSTPTVDMGADEFNVTCHCVGSASTLHTALSIAESNGEHDVIRAVQESYGSAFSYNSSDGNALVLRGGYTSGCAAGRAVDPIKTVLYGSNVNQVLDLYDSAGGDITVDGFTIQDGGGDFAPYGAGIFIKSYTLTGQSGTVTVTNNIITGNSATGAGGGVYAQSNSSSGTTGDVILTNNLIYDNDVPLIGGDSDGGGVYAELYTGDGTLGTITVVNNTIADNTGQYGGGAWLELAGGEGSDGTINCYNNIIWGNTAVASGDDIYLTKGSGTANAYNNHYADMDGDGWDNYGGNSNFDPLFVGGGVYHLQPISPCIDSGDDSASVPVLPTTDFEGDDRIIDGDKDSTATVDRGADEFSGVAPCDYDGDGKTDVGIYRPSNGGWYLRRSFVGFKRAIWGADPDDVPVPADYNGDGATDVAVFRSSTGWWYVQGVSNYLFGESGDIPVPGDYDGDGVTDVAVFRPSATAWYIRGGVNYLFGDSGDIPVPGDYDGDGVTDAAVFRPSTGWWYVRGVDNYLFGESGDIPVPADYDGDGVTDIAVYRPSSGAWYIRGVGNYLYGGAAGDIPVPGDYYGPGTTEEIGVFSNNRWFIRGASFFPLWGQTGDIPLTRNIWVWKETGLIP